jgi:hypothetical protein
MTTWSNLETSPPAGDEYAVILYAPKPIMGNLIYHLASPLYAINDALRAGFTQWAAVHAAGDHAEVITTVLNPFTVTPDAVVVAEPIPVAEFIPEIIPEVTPEVIPEPEYIEEIIEPTLKTK